MCLSVSEPGLIEATDSVQLTTRDGGSGGGKYIGIIKQESE